jgi:hypothetical protein
VAQPVAFHLKAAALAIGALLATPSICLYDLVVLAIPMAFLLRTPRRRSPGKSAGRNCRRAAALPIPRRGGVVLLRCHLREGGGPYALHYR